MAFISQSLKNMSRANQGLKHIHGSPRLEWKGGREGQRPHPPDATALPRKASFCSRKCGIDTKNGQRTLQDALCAVASRRQQDKAIICPDTSLACSPRLSSATVGRHPPSSPPRRNTDIHQPGLQSCNNQRTNRELEHNQHKVHGTRNLFTGIHLGC